MKNAKKSMFITTILMVAVLIVAVSTATFAWYTSSANPTASQAKLVAADSTEANVAIGWSRQATGSTLTFSTAPVEVSPMAPKAIPTVGTTTYSQFALETATLDTAGNFNGEEGEPAGATAYPWVVAGEGASGEAFYVVNRNVNQGVTLNMTINYAADVEDSDPNTDGNQSITYANNDKLVVAVFVEDKLAGIFLGSGLTQGYAAGQIVGGATGSLTPSEVGKTTSIEIKLDANNAGATVATASAKIQIKAWLDGNLLNQDSAKGQAAFSFTFAAAAPQAPQD